MFSPITSHIKIETKVTELDKELLNHTFVTNIPTEGLDAFLEALKEALETLENDITNND